MHTATNKMHTATNKMHTATNKTLHPFFRCIEPPIKYALSSVKYIHHHHHHHHHHHITLVARISLTLSRHSSLLFIALGRSSGQHPVSSHSCWMYVRAGRPAFARPCVGIHKSTSLMSSSLLLQQCPAFLVRLTWIVFVIGGRWPYSWCLVGCCCQDLQSWTKYIQLPIMCIQSTMICIQTPVRWMQQIITSIQPTLRCIKEPMKSIQLWQYHLGPPTHHLLQTVSLYGRWSTSTSDRGMAHFFIATRNTIKGAGEKEQTNKRTICLG